MVIIKGFCFHIGLCLGAIQSNDLQRGGTATVPLPVGCTPVASFQKARMSLWTGWEGYKKRILEDSWEITLIPGPNLSLLPYFARTNLTVGSNLAFPFSQGSRLLHSVYLGLPLTSRNHFL